MPRAPNLKPPTRRRTVLTCAALGLVVALILALLRRTAAIERIEWQFVDQRTRHFLDPSKRDPRILLAVVSDDDIAAMRKHAYEWPWPLLVNELAFQWMAAAGVAGVLVDVYHFDQGAGPGEWTTTPALRAEAEGLAQQYGAIANVSLAFQLASDRPSREPLRIPLAEEKARRLAISATPAYVRPYARLPVAALLQGAQRIGFANMDTDPDGIARRTTPIGKVLHLDPGGAAPDVDGKSGPEGPPSTEAHVFPSLPLAGAIGVSPSLRVEEDRVVHDRATQRLDAQKSFYVNFRGHSGTYPTVRVIDLVNAGSELATNPEGPAAGPASRTGLRGKIVVWGVNVAGNEDVVTTSVSQGFVGPEFQATILDNILNGDGRVAVAIPTNFGILVAICGVVGALGGAWKRRGLFVGLAALVGAVTVFAAYALFSTGAVIDLFTPIAGIVLTYAAVVAFRLLTEGRRNKWLETTFGQYLSPAVIEELKKDPSRLELGGRRTEVTVLFSDIKGFTSITEKLKERPNDFVRLMNVYLTGQSEPILVEDGVIDKFIGDAVMAFFGDPLAYGDHAIRACRAAVQSQDALVPLEPLAREFGIASVTNRIGINTGPAFLGNMGSEKRFSYTAMGDDVNLASRLEGANKAFGTHILIGPLTYEQAKDAIVAKPIAKLKVVGKQEPVVVHELVTMKERADAQLLRHVDAYRRAHAAALGDDLDAADAALKEAEALRPGDAACAWLWGMLVALRGGALPRPWNGVVVLESKG